MFQLRSGRLQRETSGVDRSQAVYIGEAIDLVKEISQTGGRSATVRPERTLHRRMVTAAKPVYSARFSTKRRRNGNHTAHWNRSAPELLHGLYPAGEGKELRDRMEVGTVAEVCGQTTAERRGRGRSHRQHAAVPPCGGATRAACGGRKSEPVQGDHTFGQEDRSQRRPQPGAGSGQRSAAGG